MLGELDHQCQKRRVRQQESARENRIHILTGYIHQDKTQASCGAPYPASARSMCRRSFVDASIGAIEEVGWYLS